MQRIGQVVAYKRLKTTGKSVNWHAQKVDAVAHRRWSFTRDSICTALTEKVLMVWLGRRLWEVVAYDWWSHM